MACRVLMELPVLGPLFRSNDYINQRTELMVLVTPYVVRAVAQERSVAAGRRLRRSERSGAGSARPFQPHLRRRRPATRSAGRLSRQTTGSSSIERGVQETSDAHHPHNDHRAAAAARRRPARRDRRRLRYSGLRLPDRPARSRPLPTSRTIIGMRHPITVTEAERTMQIFIGANRGVTRRLRSAPR